MQTALDESFITQKFDIKKGMDPWIQLDHYPVLEVKDYDSQNAEIMLENYYTLSNYTMLWIPITTKNIYVQSQDPITWFKLSEHVEGRANFSFDKNIISLKQGNKKHSRINMSVLFPAVSG